MSETTPDALATRCLRCGLEAVMTAAEAIAHDYECRKAKRGGKR